MRQHARTRTFLVGCTALVLAGCSADNANDDQNRIDDDTVITDPAGVVNDLDDDDANDRLGDVMNDG